MITEFVWVFKAEGAPFPAGVFTRASAADEWIAKHRLSGVLTAYPLDHGTYDWAVENGYFRSTKPVDPNFIGSFTSHRQKHYHYEEGVNKTPDTNHGFASPHPERE